MDVKDLLYQSIDSIGKDKIKIDINSNIESSQGHIEQILKHCVAKLGSESSDQNISTLCEALLHFMLTASALPSERKITLAHAELDIVIPSLRNLEKHSGKSLIIQVIKERSDLEKKIADAKAKQPNENNIWLVSASPLNLNYRSYSLEGNDDNFSSIICDIYKFLQDNDVRSLPFVHS